MKVISSLAVACALLAAAALAPASATAQTTGPLGLTERGRQCLCLMQEIETRRRELDLHNAMLNERETELSSLTREVDTLRPRVNPEDLAAVESFKRLLERQLSLRNFIQRELRPGYAARANSFNAMVEQFNATCAGGMPRTAPPDLQCPEFSGADLTTP